MLYYNNISQTFDNAQDQLEYIIENLKNEDNLSIETASILIENDCCEIIIDYYEDKNIDIPNVIASMIYTSESNRPIVYYYTDINHMPSNEFLYLVAKNNLEDFFLIVHRTRKDITFDINIVPGIKLDRSINMYDIFYCLIKYCEDTNLPLPPKLVENTEMSLLIKLINKVGYSMFRETKVLKYIFSNKFFTCVFVNGLDLLNVDDKIFEKDSINLYNALRDVDLDNHPTIDEDILTKISDKMDMIPIILEIIGREKSYQLISLFKDRTYFNMVSYNVHQIYPPN